MSSNLNPEKKTPPLADLFFSFLRLGLTAFGGPAMVAYIADLSVKRKKWLDQETFKEGTVLCQSLPGATAMQVTAYVGLRVGGLSGALLAYIGFGLPAFFFMTILSLLYTVSHDLHWVTSIFAGLQVIVVSLVAMATYTFGKTSIKRSADVIIAAASAVAFGFSVSPFLIIIGASIAGIALLWGKTPSPSASIQTKQRLSITRVTVLLLPVLTGLGLLYLMNTNLFKLALLMLKTDLFAFGGGFSSLPLMLQQVVHVQKWMDSKTFMDGIALGQITPGPIVITATFVGLLTNGFLGALVATLGIFTPSFILLVFAAPFFDRLKQSRLFKSASRGISSSFVGLLIFVTIKFAVTVHWDLIRIILVSATTVALFRKVDILYVVLIGSVISLILL
jgi:chromate transporter